MARSQQVTIRETITIRRVPDSDEDFLGDQVAYVPAMDLSWADGTSTGESDLTACDVGLSISGSGTASLDLNALAKGPGGATVAFAEVRAILIRVPSTNGDDITVSPNVTNGWTALGSSLSIDIQPGTYFRYVCPTDGRLPVSASDKVLDFANNSGSAVTLDICILGVSA